jgi:hypothetical protein
MKKHKKEYERVNKGYAFAMACASMSFIALIIIFLLLMITSRL